MRLLFLLAAAGLLCLGYAIKKTRLRTALLSALSGIAALFAADLVCTAFGGNLAMNAFTLTVSAVGGIPGVVLLNLLTALFR